MCSHQPLEEQMSKGKDLKRLLFKMSTKRCIDLFEVKGNRLTVALLATTWFLMVKGHLTCCSQPGCNLASFLVDHYMVF